MSHLLNMPQEPTHQRRRKVTLACEPCRERKARCDGTKPLCSTCRRRALGIEQCVYKAGNARTACSDKSVLQARSGQESLISIFHFR